MMLTRTKRYVASACASAMMFVAVASPASGQVAVQDGLVNVAIGDVTILEDVNVGVAANVAANVCGVKVGPVAVLGNAVDRSGETDTVCNSAAGPIRITQN